MNKTYFSNITKYFSVALAIAVLSGGAYLYREHGLISEAHVVNNVAVVPNNQVSQPLAVLRFELTNILRTPVNFATSK